MMVYEFSEEVASADEYLPAPNYGTHSETLNQRLEEEPLDAGDPLLDEAKELLEIYGGIIFTGPPGTSKSWYARRIGWTLAEGDQERIAFFQFHPSYQYEDFMQALVPREDGPGFEPARRGLMLMCEAAEDDSQHDYVVVIDELSRADPGRVFGEALTYIERSKRGMEFRLAMGEERVRIPDNLLVLATMNPLDRGVDEVDAAFERRFAKIAMEPDRDLVAQFLEANDVEEERATGILDFFDFVNQRARQNPLTALGHTSFLEVTDEPSMEKLWRHQLRFHFEKAYRLNPQEFEEIEERWHDLYRDRD